MINAKRSFLMLRVGTCCCVYLMWIPIRKEGKNTRSFMSAKANHINLHCKKIEVYMNKFMNLFFFLPQLILKLPGFVSCFVLFSGESCSQLLATLLLMFLCSHLFLLFVNFGYLQIPPPPLYWCNFYLLLLPKQNGWLHTK